MLVAIGCSDTETNAKLIDEENDYENFSFTITGDFDGDGAIDTLLEKYISSVDSRTLPKTLQGKEYDTLVALTLQTQPLCLLIDPNGKLDTLEISNLNQQFGLAYLKNEGDLNGDGIDEISFVVDWADWSSTNTCYIYSYVDSKWEKIYSFSIFDSQLPDYTSATSMDTFEGLIEKIDNDTIIINTRNREIGALRKKIWDLNFPEEWCSLCKINLFFGSHRHQKADNQFLVFLG